MKKQINTEENAPAFIGRMKRVHFIRGLALGFLILNLWETFWTIDRGKFYFALGHVFATLLSAFVIFLTYVKTKPS